MWWSASHGLMLKWAMPDLVSMWPAGSHAELSFGKEQEISSSVFSLRQAKVYSKSRIAMMLVVTPEVKP